MARKSKGAGRVVLVTGGAGGIGRAVVKRLAEEGFRVVVFSRSLGGQRVEGAKMSKKVDVAESNQVEEGVRDVLKRFGSVYALVNVAGIPGPIGPIEKISLREWNETLAVNLTGAFIVCKCVVPSMVKERKGRIVNVASMVGKRPTAFRAAYSASKMGMIGLTRSLSRELGGFGITVNAVCPGAVEGRRIDRVVEETAKASGESVESVRRRLQGASALGRFLSPGEVADVIAFLVSDGASMITGQEIEVV